MKHEKLINDDSLFVNPLLPTPSVYYNEVNKRIEYYGYSDPIIVKLNGSVVKETKYERGKTFSLSAITIENGKKYTATITGGINVVFNTQTGVITGLMTKSGITAVITSEATQTHTINFYENNSLVSSLSKKAGDSIDLELPDYNALAYNYYDVSVSDLTYSSGSVKGTMPDHDVNVYYNRGSILNYALEGGSELEEAAIAGLDQYGIQSIDPNQVKFANLISNLTSDWIDESILPKASFINFGIYGLNTIGLESLKYAINLKMNEEEEQQYTKWLENVEGIESMAFYGCVTLEKIYLRNITQIDDNAFEHCDKLETVVLNDIEYSGRTELMEALIGKGALVADSAFDYTPLCNMYGKIYLGGLSDKYLTYNFRQMKDLASGTTGNCIYRMYITQEDLDNAGMGISVSDIYYQQSPRDGGENKYQGGDILVSCMYVDGGKALDVPYAVFEVYCDKMRGECDIYLG